MKPVFVLFSSTFLVMSCINSSKLNANRALLKEYAYCKCFQYASGDTAYFTRDVSLSVYFDIANYNFSAYDKIDSLAKVAVSKFKPLEVADYQNKKAVFFNCFNFYKSKRLDSVVRSLDKEVTKSW